jgi:hypothetical protein
VQGGNLTTKAYQAGYLVGMAESEAIAKELWEALNWMIVKCRFESQEGRRVRDKYKEKFST